MNYGAYTNDKTNKLQTKKKEYFEERKIEIFESILVFREGYFVQ